MCRTTAAGACFSHSDSDIWRIHIYNNVCFIPGCHLPSGAGLSLPVSICSAVGWFCRCLSSPLIHLNKVSRPGFRYPGSGRFFLLLSEMQRRMQPFSVQGKPNSSILQSRKGKDGERVQNLTGTLKTESSHKTRKSLWHKAFSGFTGCPLKLSTFKIDERTEKGYTSTRIQTEKKKNPPVFRR